MANTRCKQCGAPVDLLSEKKRCDYCGTPFSATATYANETARSPRLTVVIILAVSIFFVVIGIAVALLSFGRSTPVAHTVVAVAAPDLATRLTPDLAPPPRPAVPLPPPPPRAPTLHDKIRDHFMAAGVRLCVEGNLTQFGPFAGTVRLTCHPDGLVTRLGVEIQPSAPRVATCLREKLAQGPVYSGAPLDLIFHFSGGRSADGLQYREGIELQERSR
jgi:hypothetical protein